MKALGSGYIKEAVNVKNYYKYMSVRVDVNRSLKR